MKQDRIALENYEKGFQRLKKTVFQTKINDYCSGSEKSLGEGHENYFNGVSRDLGRRGMSQKDRVVGILGDFIEKNWDNFNYFEKSHSIGLLDVAEENVSKNAKRIKDSSEILSSIQTLKNKLNYNPLAEFNKQEEVQKSGLAFYQTVKGQNNGTTIEEVYTPALEITPATQNIQIQDYQRTGKRKAGSVGKAKEALIILGLTAVAAVGVAVYSWGRHDGRKDQQPIINQQQEIIKDCKLKFNSQEQTLSVYKTTIDSQKELISNSEKTVSDSVAQQKCLEQKLIAAGRPDAEVRKESVEETTKILKSQYEKVIESTKQEARNQADKLLEQQNINVTNVSDYNSIKQQDSNLVTSYTNKPIEENIPIKEKVGYLAGTGKAINNASKFVGGVFYNTKKGLGNLFKSKEAKQEAKEKVIYVSKEEINETPGLIDSNSNIILPSNIVWEDRMAMIGPVKKNWRSPKLQCLCDEIYKEMDFQEEQYLIDKPWDDPHRLHVKADKLWKQRKKWQSLETKFGEGLATVNDALEGPVRGVTKVIGGVWGGTSKTLGNKWDGFDNGWKNGDKFGASFMDGIFGVSKRSMDYYLSRLDVKKAVAVPFCMEPSKKGAYLKLVHLLAVDTAWLWWNPVFGDNNGGSNGSSGGIKRTGGPVDGGGLSSGGGTVR